MRFFAALAVAAGAPDGDRGTGRGTATMRPVRAGAVRGRRADAEAGARLRPRQEGRHDGASPTRTSARSTAPPTASRPACWRARCRVAPLRYAIVGQPERVTGAGAGGRARRGRRADGPRHHAGAGGGDRRGQPGDPLDRRQRARRRGERHRRVAARALGAGRPPGLRGAADPRRVDRRDPPDAEPRRPRGGHAAQRLRLRHEPRLVRAHPARDGRQARAAARATRRSCSSTRTRWATPAGYFFPPNADPVYHEITDQAIGWINGLYGPAMQDVFDARGIPYFNYATYDLFYMGYGDTVPATGFGAAGMTFEKTDSDPAHKRVYEQYLTQWTSLSAAAADKQAILTGWHDSWAEARDQGRAGDARAQRGRAAREHGPARGAGHHRAPVLHPRRRPGEGARGAGARAAAAADGRRGRAAHGAGLACPTSRPTGALRGRRRCRPAPTSSAWASARSTGCRRCSTRTRTRRSRTSTT